MNLNWQKKIRATITLISPIPFSKSQMNLCYQVNSWQNTIKKEP